MNCLMSKAAAVWLAASTALAANPVVQLETYQITYTGTTAGSVEHFKNIRFGKDTSGTRRFAPPELYNPPEGSKIDASLDGPACPQLEIAIPPILDATPYMSEDCLNLRIARPIGTTAKDKLPVVVQLPGGGLVKGSPYDRYLDPENLVTLSASINKPVLYVALNYRLTIFGFARLPILKEQKSMNVGMRDQRLGFEWVKKNIAAFGGDPERITAFGVSAGGTTSSLHLLSYGGEQGVPFTQIWSLSGPPGSALNSTSDATEFHTHAVAEELGCNFPRDVETLECLRDVPMEKLRKTAIEYSIKNHPPMGLLTFIPSVDGDFWPDRASALYRTGRFVKGIPMVMGWTQDEGATLIGPPSEINSEEEMKKPLQSFISGLNERDYQDLFALYSVDHFTEDVARYEARRAEADPAVSVHWFRASRILRDIGFTCSSIDFVHEMSRYSRMVDPGFSDARVYAFNQSLLQPVFRAAGMPYVNALHGSDMNYILNCVFYEGSISKSDRKLCEAMSGALINFIHSGNPSHDGDFGFSTWPGAFPNLPSEEEEQSAIPSFNLQVIGGPFGTGSCYVEDMMGDGDSKTPADLGRTQVPLMDGTLFEDATALAKQFRRQELERDKLLTRCAYINSLSEKLKV